MVVDVDADALNEAHHQEQPAESSEKLDVEIDSNTEISQLLSVREQSNLFLT